MLDNTGITEQVQAEICRLAAKHQLDKVILFGSRAKGGFHRASDIDLAARGGNVAEFALDVDEETSTLLKYDVVDLGQDISAELLRSIHQEGRVLYEKKFENYCANLAVLSLAGQQDLENEFVIGGIIDKFMIQFELGWKVLKELLRYEGRSEANSGSPREILKTAFQVYEFIDEDAWVAMLSDRNSMSHVYDGNAARRLVDTILADYIPAFQRVQDGIMERYPGVI